MNAQLLIDAIVRQTTLLIAQLATAGGLRAPLAHVANQVFLDLAKELEAQGVSRRVSADMFGMALRAYLRKIQRLREGSTVRGETLWEAVYSHLCDHDILLRQEIIDHFAQDDEALVRGVLHDLCESGLIFYTGSGAEAVFRAATDAELGRIRQARQERLDELLWALIYREGPVSDARVRSLMAEKSDELEHALGRLKAAGRIRPAGTAAAPAWEAPRFSIPLDATTGWEAAVFDHFQAMVRTICAKLGQSTRAHRSDTVGGSTYTYEVWPGHPCEQEVIGALSRFRREHGELRQRVKNYNHAHPLPETRTRVVVYGGQCVIEENGDEDDV